MELTVLLDRLKMSLPLSSDAYDQLLTQYLQTAIDKFGADISKDEDQTLVILYAQWLWNNNKTPGIGKPQALQMAVNDRAVRRDVR